MFGLKYLSNEKKALLAKAQESLTRTKVYQERNNAELIIEEILSGAKPYSECDLIQADELRSQLYQQINILQGLGKQQATESFRMHLRDVEFHIQTLQMKERMQEEGRLRTDQPPCLEEDRMPSLSSKKRERSAEKRKQKAVGRTRWTIDMDETE